MDAKIKVEIICIHCNSKIQISKPAAQTSCQFDCPGCHKTLRLMFDLSAGSQRYAFLPTTAKAEPKPVPKPPRPSNVTDPRITGHIKPTGHTTDPDPIRKKVDPKKTVYRRNIESTPAYSGDGIPGEQSTHQSSKTPRTRFKSKFHLCRKKRFGLKGDVYPLFVGPNIIGREDSRTPSDISIAGDSTISRRSVQIDVVKAQYGHDCFVTLLYSSNPVTVNGRQLNENDKIELRPGDYLTLGNTSLKLEKE